MVLCCLVRWVGGGESDSEQQQRRFELMYVMTAVVKRSVDSIRAGSFVVKERSESKDPEQFSFLAFGGNAD